MPFFKSILCEFRRERAQIIFFARWNFEDCWTSLRLYLSVVQFASRKLAALRMTSRGHSTKNVWPEPQQQRAAFSSCTRTQRHVTYRSHQFRQDRRGSRVRLLRKSLLPSPLLAPSSHPRPTPPIYRRFAPHYSTPPPSIHPNSTFGTSQASLQTTTAPPLLPPLPPHPPPAVATLSPTTTSPAPFNSPLD